MSDFSPTRWAEDLRELSFFMDRFAGPRFVRLERRGILWAALSMLAFSASVALIGSEWERELATARAVDEHLRAVVQASHPARRNLTEIGKVAILLANSNQAGVDGHSVDQLPARWRTIFEAFANVVELRQVTAVDVLPCAGASALTGFVEGFEDVDAYRSKTRPYPLDPSVVAAPLEAQDRVAVLDGFALGPAGCLGEIATVPTFALGPSSTDLATFIPSAAVHEKWTAMSQGGQLVPPARHRAACGQAGAALLDDTACLLADAAVAIEENREDWAEDSELAQAYFVSATGGVVVWSRGSDVRDSMWREPMTWYGAGSTFTHFTKRPSFINRGTVVVTPAYFDFLGAGLVRTACAPVYRGEAFTWLDGHQDGSDAFAGVFCIDVSVRVTGSNGTLVGPEATDLLTKTVDIDTPLFETSIYCTADKAVFEYSDAPGTCSGKGVLASLTDEELGLIAKATDGPFVRNDRQAALSAESRGAAAVLLRRLDNSTEKVVALLRPKRITPDGTRLVGGGLSFILAMAFAGIATRRGQEERARLTALELLRSLPVGVAMLDQKGEIVFGNDRAEELLGAALPTNWDDADQPASQRFDRFFPRTDGADREDPPRILAFAPDGQLKKAPEGADGSDRSKPFSEQLKDLRARGRPYAYQLPLPERLRREGARYLSVRGTPILRAPGGRNALRGSGKEEWYALGVFDIELRTERVESAEELLPAHRDERIRG